MLQPEQHFRAAGSFEKQTWHLVKYPSLSATFSNGSNFSKVVPIERGQGTSLRAPEEALVRLSNSCGRHEEQI